MLKFVWYKNTAAPLFGAAVLFLGDDTVRLSWSQAEERFGEFGDDATDFATAHHAAVVFTIV